VALAALLVLGLESAAAAQVQSIEVGVPIGGSLDPSDSVDPRRGQLADLYTFEGSAGQRIEVLMRSTAIDCYLTLEGADGQPMAADDDGAGNLDSRVFVTLPITGTYTIVASSFAADTGSYELLLREYRAQPIAYLELAPSRTVHGSLDETDGTRGDGRAVDGYRFAGAVGDRVLLSLESDAFDAYLILIGPTGEVIAQNDDVRGGVTDSALTVQLEHAGAYRVLATSYASGTGAYRLRLEPVRLRPIIDRAIEADRPLAGRLEATDGLWPIRNTWADGFTFEGAIGDQVEVTIEGGTLDPFLVLLGPNGEIVAENDDSGAGLDSRLVTRLASDGVFRIVVTTYTLASGDYLVSLRNLVPTEPVATPLDLAGVPHLSVEGAFDDDDLRRAGDGSRFDLYELRLDMGQRVVIEVDAESSGAAVWVTAPTGETIAEAHGAGTGDAALVDVTAPYTGLYRLGLAESGGSPGAYTLSVRDQADGSDQHVEIAVGAAVTGTLEHGDARRPGPESYRDTYTFDLEQGDSLEIRLDSTELDPYLLLHGPDGNLLAQDDDGGGGLNSRIHLIALESGSYVVHASSYQPAIGSYTLVVDRFEPPPVSVTAVAMGDTVEGVLSEADPRSPRYGTLIDTYSIRLEQGTRFEAVMRSSVLDAYLTVVDPNGEPLAEDDDSGGGLDASITLSASLSGEYLILVSSARYALGEYTLSVAPVRAEVDRDPIRAAPR